MARGSTWPTDKDTSKIGQLVKTGSEECFRLRRGSVV